MKNIGAGVAVALMGTVPGPSIADVKDYEVIRFLYLKTSCGRSTITRIETLDSGLRFHAVCQDLTSFTDGAVVLCSDPSDDRSCTLETKPQEFKDLHLLRP